jgi:2-amino-4-hydroxy-6-hydroxymethyldihydropteridine diphosphokinase
MMLVAIGANLPGPGGLSPLETCRRAVASLDSLAGLRVRALSRWYRSAPVPPSGQPSYINAVAHLAVQPGFHIAPEVLLARLMTLEAEGGRQRGETNAARTLDLDIITIREAVGDLVRDTPDPILPHPRAHERAFVLLPLRDVAPGWVHPVLRLGVDALIAALPAQEIQAL